MLCSACTNVSYVLANGEQLMFAGGVWMFAKIGGRVFVGKEKKAIDSLGWTC